MLYLIDNARSNKNHVYIYLTFKPFFLNRVVYEIIWKNIVQPDRPHMTIWRMSCACWIPKATDTHSEYSILIVFALQQLLQERASVLSYTSGFTYAFAQRILYTKVRAAQVLVRHSVTRLFAQTGDRARLLPAACCRWLPCGWLLRELLLLELHANL